MNKKNGVEVIINGKRVSLGGYESEEYLQRVASYLNAKYNELKQMESYRMLDAEMKNMYLQLNLADDYFKLKKQMEETTKELEEKEITAAAGGGAVKVTVTGKKEVKSVEIDPEVLDPDDVEMLQDLIVAATNEALREMEKVSQAQMAKITGGLGGGFPF